MHGQGRFLVRLAVGSTPESPVDVAVGGRAEPKASLVPAVARPVLSSADRQ